VQATERAGGERSTVCWHGLSRTVPDHGPVGPPSAQIDTNALRGVLKVNYGTTFS